MSRPTLLSLPIELLQYVAIHARTTKDALGLAHANRALYEAIATPFVFQMRLREGGWDLRAWEEEAIGLSEDLARRLWIRADFSCGIVTFSLTTAREPLHFERADSRYHIWYPRLTFTQWDSFLCDCGEDDVRALDEVFVEKGHMQLLDGEKVWEWLSSFAKPFSHVLTHDGPITTSANLEKITSLAGGGEIWLAILRILVGLVHNRILSQRPVVLPSDFCPDMSPDLAAMLYNSHQLERFASTFAHFVLSCDLADLERIFGEHRDDYWPAYTARHWANNAARLTHERLFSSWTPTAHDGAYAHTVTETRRFSSSFVCATTFMLDLRLCPSGMDFLTVPRAPPVQDMRLWTSLLPRHGLEGTPLADAPSDGGPRAWGGYYGFYQEELETRRRDPPMILELAVAVSQSDMIHLFGEGQDHVGHFTLSVRVARHTGLFDGIKSYTDNQARWDWRGCVTPFGLVGRWGDRNWGGPVWIWPREWSES